MDKLHAVKKAAAPRKRAAKKAANPDHDDIAMAAYFIAESRGFEPGHELDDWLKAEGFLLTKPKIKVARNGNGRSKKAAEAHAA